MKKTKSSFVNILLFIAPVISFGLIIALWVVASKGNPFLFPTLEQIGTRFKVLCTAGLAGTSLLMHVWISFRKILVAIMISGVLGVAAGTFMGWTRWGHATFGAVFDFIRPVPPLAWMPLLIMLFGSSEKTKLILMTMGTFISICINTYTGIKLVEPIHLQVGKSFGANTRQLLVEIALPSALPCIFNGLRHAAGTGFTVVVAAEMFTGLTGMGFIINNGMQWYDVPLLMIGIVMLGIMGALLAALVESIERRLCPWDPKLTKK